MIVFFLVDRRVARLRASYVVGLLTTAVSLSEPRNSIGRCGDIGSAAIECPLRYTWVLRFTHLTDRGPPGGVWWTTRTGIASAVK